MLGITPGRSGRPTPPWDGVAPIEVFRSDLAFAQPVKEVIAERRRQTAPPDAGHYSRKVRTANSSLGRGCSDRGLPQGSCVRAAGQRGDRGAQEADRSTGCWALLTEGQDGQLLLETGLLFHIAGTRQAVGQLEEAFPFLLPGFDTGFDELHNDAVGAHVACLRQRFHPAGDARGESDALT